MNLRQAAYWLAVIPLLALVVTLGAVVGAPRQVLPTLKGFARRPLPPPPPPPLPAVVAGLVTKNGQPVANATVQLHDANGRAVTATTDSEGRYHVSLAEGGKLVVAEPLDSLAVSAEEAPGTKPEDGGKPPLRPRRKVTMKACEVEIKPAVEQ